MRQALLLTSLFITAITYADVKPISTTEELRTFTDDVMVSVAKAEFEAAFGKLKPYWPMPQAEIDVALNQILDQRGAVARRFGDSIGFEFIRLKMASDSLAKVVYLEKFERHAVVWRFFFYKPHQQWLVNTFFWNDNIPGAFSCDA